MSIAALSNSFVSQLRRSPAPAVDAAEPVPAVPRAAREQGRRHELVAAMNQALGIDAAAAPHDKRSEQALFRFAHTLMHDLRTLAGEASDGPRAWGRSDWGDLPQRLSTLATAASGAAADAAPEVPAQPDPITTATAAVHIMKVPSSHLLAAFVAMQRALGADAGVQSDDRSDEHDGALDADRAALAELLRRLASAVAPASASTLPAGTVLDVSA